MFENRIHTQRDKTFSGAFDPTELKQPSMRTPRMDGSLRSGQAAPDAFPELEDYPDWVPPPDPEPGRGQPSPLLHYGAAAVLRRAPGRRGPGYRGTSRPGGRATWREPAAPALPGQGRPLPARSG